MPLQPPKLSIVIPTFNRRERLRTCLQALERQTQDPIDFEVVVADDGSTDGTADMVESLQTPLRLRVLRLQNGGWTAAANAGAGAAAGEICLQIDDDVLASPQLVAEHLAAHQGRSPTMAVGRLIQEPPKSKDWFVGAYTTAWNRRYDELAERKTDWRDCFGANFSAPAELLRKAGGFLTDKPALADMELGYRLNQAGCTPLYLPRAEAVHDDEKDRERLLRDGAGFGGFAATFAERHPETRTLLFGWYGSAGPREAALRQLLLTLNVPPALLARLGDLLPGRDRKQHWYDFIARYSFWFATRAAMAPQVWSETIRGVPVLMYHGFTDSSEEDRFVMPRRAFELQMRVLKGLRYRSITLAELARTLADGRPLPRRSVVITIDDGYRDNFEIARPILRNLGMQATLFPVSGRLGAANDWNDSGVNQGRSMLSEAELREMSDAGFEVGAHTRSHPHLPELDPAASAAEIDSSRADLEALTGGPVATFAYPYGEFTDETVAMVSAAGFDGACTTESRLARAGDDPMRIPRLEIQGADTLRNFVRKIYFGGF